MRIFLLSLFLASFTLLSAQSTDKNTHVVIHQILMEGNKKTKERTILREMDFAIGDSIPTVELIERLKKNEALILNSGLFTSVKINIQDWNTDANQVTVKVIVREMWYIYPNIVFELADRNFNVWWEEQNRSLSRVNYGMRFYYQNLTGRRDQLKLVAHFGYTKKFEAEYNLPMVGKSKEWGVFGSIFYADRKEIAYLTEASRLLFKKQEGEPILLKRFRLGAGTTYRRGIFQYHTAKLLFSSNWIGDTISQVLNPDYFLDARNRQKHFTFQYNFTLDKRDVKPYPIKGNFVSLLLQQDGLGFFDDVNVFAATGTYAHYFPIKEKWSFGAKAKGRYTFNRKEQPYTHVYALGYGVDYLRGYEFYVIDGMDYAYLKTHFRYRILKKEINWGKYMFIPQFRIMPIKVYLALNNDWGYVNAPYNGERSTLSNQLLWGRGVGLDFVIFYDKVLQFEYSFNDLNEQGFFLHFELSF